MTHAIKRASLILVIAAAWIGATDIIHGARIETIRAIVDTPAHLGRDRLLAAWAARYGSDPADLADITPIEGLALAALWIDQAAVSPLRQRDQALRHAGALLARVTKVRPESPGAALLHVRADLVRFGQPRAATLAYFANSYQYAGYLRDAGLWRLAFVATYWSRLSPTTRKAAVNEAIWLARIDGRLRIAVERLVTGTPLALPVELRLISSSWHPAN